MLAGRFEQIYKLGRKVLFTVWLDYKSNLQSLHPSTNWKGIQNESDDSDKLFKMIRPKCEIIWSKTNFKKLIFIQFNDPKQTLNRIFICDCGIYLENSKSNFLRVSESF